MPETLLATASPRSWEANSATCDLLFRARAGEEERLLDFALAFGREADFAFALASAPLGGSEKGPSRFCISPASTGRSTGMRRMMDDGKTSYNLKAWRGCPCGGTQRCSPLPAPRWERTPDAPKLVRSSQGSGLEGVMHEEVRFETFAELAPARNFGHSRQGPAHNRI